MIRALMLWALLSAAPPEPAAGRIIYFDPDANHQAIVNISLWFTEYLASRKLDLTFQAVQSREDFIKLAAAPDTRFAIVGSYYLRELAEGCEPLLVPAVDGQPFYVKVLLDSGQGSAGDLRGVNIAASMVAQNSALGFRNVFDMLKKGGVQLDGAHGIAVSKDIDALLGLAFGQVQAALVTRESVKVLKQINPAAVSKFRTVFTTEPILRSPLCRFGRRATEQQKNAVTAALLTMVNDDVGRKAVRTMGFDSWINFEPGMLKP